MKSIVFVITTLVCFSFMGFSADLKSPQTTGNEFAVQILLSGNHLQPANKKFKGVTDIHEEVCDGLFKYKYTTAHNVKTFAEANAIRLKMIDAGFTGAFVVRYRDGQRIMPDNSAKANTVKTNNVPVAVKTATVRPKAVSIAARTATVKQNVVPLTTKPAMVKHKTTAEVTEPKTKAGKGSAVVQTRPEFPGGEEGIVLYTKNNLHYPAHAVEQNQAAQVYVSFTVDNAGKVQDAKVVAGINDEMNAEALRLINTMPDWKPGTIDGNAINMECIIPVDFREPVLKQMATRDSN